MRARLIIAALGLCLAIPAAAQAGQRLPLLPTDTSTKHNLQVRPFAIDFTGDGTGWLGGFDGTGRYPNWGRLHWSRWTRTQATGHGALWLNTCRPDCADGTFHASAVTVYATQVRANVFRLLTLRYSYDGEPVVDRRPIHETAVDGHHTFTY